MRQDTYTTDCSAVTTACRELRLQIFRICLLRVRVIRINGVNAYFRFTAAAELEPGLLSFSRAQVTHCSTDPDKRHEDGCTSEDHEGVGCAGCALQRGRGTPHEKAVRGRSRAV